MKALLILAMLPAAAQAVDCETVRSVSVPAPHAFVVRKPAPRAVGVPRPAPVRKVRAAAPAGPRVYREVTRYDCPPPSSRPPGAGWVVPGVPYIGTPPAWGYPAGWVPTGPAPLYPPDFPPGVYIPPADTPPGRTPPAGPPDTPPADVPEPTMMFIPAFGLLLYMTRNKRLT